jgi:ketosteroid isomerase-like protein
MTAEKVLLDLDKRRCDAMVRGDIATLKQLLSPRLVYVHSHGGRDTKNSYLQALSAGAVSYRFIDHRAERVDVTGSVAVIIGTMRAEVTNRGGSTRRLHTVTTAVWSQADGSWQLLVFHATTVPNDEAGQ